MATYTYDVVPIDQDGSKAFDNATKMWIAIETFLDTRGALGWEVVATLDTTAPRQIILKKTTP